MSYVKAAKELPKMNEAEIHEKARQYGFIDEDEEARAASFTEKDGSASDSASDGIIGGRDTLEPVEKKHGARHFE
jgi:hypothetical protein